MMAEKMGLIVITLERYFKIVHAIADRKYYRDWMTKVGVALPWIGGTCLILIPGMCTARIVNGRCLKLTVWPHEDMKFVSIHIIFFSFCIIVHVCLLNYYVTQNDIPRGFVFISVSVRLRENEQSCCNETARIDHQRLVDYTC